MRAGADCGADGGGALVRDVEAVGSMVRDEPLCTRGGAIGPCETAQAPRTCCVVDRPGGRAAVCVVRASARERAFEELLRSAHGALCREAEQARGVLLQRRRAVRRHRGTFLLRQRQAVQRRGPRALQALCDLVRALRGEALLWRGRHLDAVGLDELRTHLKHIMKIRRSVRCKPARRRRDPIRGGKRGGRVEGVCTCACQSPLGTGARGAAHLRRSRLQRGADGVVLLRAEEVTLELALAEQAQRGRLHAPRRLGARQLRPEHGRERESQEVVHAEACQIGGDEVVADIARRRHRLAHRRLRDGAERHAFHLAAALQRASVLHAKGASAQRDPSNANPLIS